MKQEIINKTTEYVKEKLSGEGTGHDWWHTHRVCQTALLLGEKESADLFIIQMAALLHDLGDPKLYGGDTTVAKKIVPEFLNTLTIDQTDKEHILDIVFNSSFSKTLGNKSTNKSKEFEIVQDADRLDALGAIGIARVFAMGGKLGREIHNPKEQACQEITTERYLSREGTSVNHFYEKILLLKDLMNTETGKRIANKRHKFIEIYLDQFYSEWNGKDIE